ncbi:hypothetical protein TNCT_22041 [Trichonephila clavata]|uniref:Uncharacterized protein n=1 Tax=Trichonephila clavata TaxID=2740835 RepID=A0A8X6M0A2_TRICU|nr:hypothetical protein TNCT_22041 [Trichonephila clavata]
MFAFNNLCYHHGRGVAVIHKSDPIAFSRRQSQSSCNRHRDKSPVIDDIIVSVSGGHKSRSSFISLLIDSKSLIFIPLALQIQNDNGMLHSRR